MSTTDADAVARRLHHYGGWSAWPASAEVLGGHDAGPNYTLPTGRVACALGGPSVLTFLWFRT